jgi:hypothetical protein
MGPTSVNSLPMRTLYVRSQSGKEKLYPASNLFFQVISARHDQGLGTIATTNLPFGKWNQIFANDAITHVIVDRLTAEAEVQIDGTNLQPNVCSPLRNEERKNCSSCRIRKPHQWRDRHLPWWSARSDYREISFGPMI